MKKEIIFNWYSNMSEPNKSQLKTLFNIWCLGLFDKTFDLNEDNLYTFLCDYFVFKPTQAAGIDIYNVYRKISMYYLTYIFSYPCNHNNNIIAKRLISEIRENI